jgi:hypothetical protein
VVRVDCEGEGRGNISHSSAFPYTLFAGRHTCRVLFKRSQRRKWRTPWTCQHRRQSFQTVSEDPAGGHWPVSASSYAVLFARYEVLLIVSRLQTTKTLRKQWAAEPVSSTRRGT